MQGKKVQQVNNFIITKIVKEAAHTFYNIYNPYGVLVNQTKTLEEARNLCASCYAYIQRQTPLTDEQTLERTHIAIMSTLSKYSPTETQHTKGKLRMYRLNYSDYLYFFLVVTLVKDRVKFGLAEVYQDTNTNGKPVFAGEQTLPRRDIMNEFALNNAILIIESYMNNSLPNRVMYAAKYVETNIQQYLDSSILGVAGGKPISELPQKIFGKQFGYVIFLKYANSDEFVNDERVGKSTNVFGEPFVDEVNSNKAQTYGVQRWDGVTIEIRKGPSARIECGYRYYDDKKGYSKLQLLDCNVEKHEIPVLPRRIANSFQSAVEHLDLAE